MASRQRERRRSKNERAAILRPGASTQPTTPLQHGTRGINLQWRAVSGLIVVSLLIVLVLFIVTDAFYVRTISVAGVEYLQSEEVFRWADIANIHVFWVDPEAVRASLLEIPAIADAQVTVGFPPNLIRIAVQERQPAIIWQQADIETWVDIQGNVLMIPTEERPDLLRIMVEDIDVPVHPSEVIPPSVINGALQLRDVRPDLSVLRYHQDFGLGFRDERGWDAWFGDGLHMAEKMQTYRAVVEYVQSISVTPAYINITNPDAPYYCERLTGCG